MLKPSADLIIDPKQSRYSLVVGVAKRARQIVEEAEKAGEILVESLLIWRSTTLWKANTG